LAATLDSQRCLDAFGELRAGSGRFFGRVFRFVLGFLAETSAQKGILWWAAHHRDHHKHSDKEGDIHSPKQRGLWYAHVGWLYDNTTDTKLSKVRDLARFPELVWLNRYWIVPPFLTALLCLAIGGWSGVCLGFFTSTVLVWHATFCVNSLAHVIGKRRFERALAMRPQPGLLVRWLPFQLNPAMPATGLERQHYLTAKFGGVERAEKQYDRIRRAGREEGIDFQFDRIVQTPNTVDSHRLIHFAGLRGDQNGIVESLFQAYFLEGRDIGNRNVLVDIADTAGLDATEVARYLQGDEDRNHIVGLDEIARRNGITGVPCFIIEDKYAVSGAQSPEIFHQIFELVRQEEAYPAGQSATG